MTQRSMFFDSTSGDRIYTSDAWAQIFGRIFSDGVVAGYAAGMAVVQNTPAAMNVVVGLGSIWVQGRFLDVYTSAEVQTIATSDPTNPRIDRIIARVDMTGRTLALAVLKGTAASSPVAPTLTQTSTTWEVSLAQVRVNAGATSILTANITDERTFVTNAAAIAFGKIAVGASTILSSTAADTLTVTAGSGITLTPNTGTKTVTVAVTANSVDAATLDGIDSTGFALVVHNHDTRYVIKNGTGDNMNGFLLLNAAATSDQPILILQQTTTGPAPGVYFRSVSGGSSDDVTALRGGTTGARTLAVTAAQGITVNGERALTGTGSGGNAPSQVFVGASAPTPRAVGDIWIDTSVVL